MKWVTPEQYTEGATRVIEKFLLIPRSALNKKNETEVRWLERARIEQRYDMIMTNFDHLGGADFAMHWTDVRWVD